MGVSPKFLNGEELLPMKQNKEKISPWKTRFGLLLVLFLMVIHYTFKWFGKLQGAEFYAILMLLLLGVFVLLFVNIKAVGDSIGSLIGRIKKIESSGQSIHLDTKIEGTSSEASKSQNIIKNDALRSKDSSGENYATKDLASLQALAKNNDPKAQFYLGIRYSFGQGVEQDYQEAVNWYRKSAEQGDARAQYNLGICYSQGEGVEQDSQKAVVWYKKSAEQGIAEAQYNLGICYKKGEGVEQDYKEAVNWYRKSAEQGDASAQYNLGFCYDKGEGVKQDDQEAVKWYRKSAEQGNAYAQNNLGFCYDKGEGVKQDDQEAVKWYRKSAEQGNANAQYNLGVCYYKGQGVLKSWVLAHMWHNLSGINRKLLKDLEKKMTKEQVIDALDRALKWKDKKENEGAAKS